MNRAFLDLHVLRCPRCHADFVAEPTAPDPIQHGALNCRNGHRFPIVRGVPRFVDQDAYTDSFSYEWQTFRRTQLDSQTGRTDTRDRLLHAVFAKNCVGCHVGGATLAGLSLDTYAGAMKGGSTAAGGVVNGPVIKPGDAAGSYLYQAITGKQKVGAQMPLARPPLSASDIQLIYNWIQGGAKQ